MPNREGRVDFDVLHTSCVLLRLEKLRLNVVSELQLKRGQASLIQRCSVAELSQLGKRGHFLELFLGGKDAVPLPGSVTEFKYFCNARTPQSNEASEDELVSGEVCACVVR